MLRPFATKVVSVGSSSAHAIFLCEQPADGRGFPSGSAWFHPTNSLDDIVQVKYDWLLHNRPIRQINITVIVIWEPTFIFVNIISPINEQDKNSESNIIFSFLELLISSCE